MKIINKIVKNWPKIFNNVYYLLNYDSQVYKIQKAIFANTFKQL